jgi:hypothetical protein
MRRMICFLCLWFFPVALFATNPAVGHWELDPGKSRSSDLPKQETLIIEDQGNDMSVTVTGTNRDGSPISLKFTEPWNGGPGRVEQGHFDGVTGRRTSDASYFTTYLKDGKPVQTSHAVVLKKGTMMRVLIKGTDKQGRPFSDIAIFMRE